MKSTLVLKGLLLLWHLELVRTLTVLNMEGRGSPLVPAPFFASGMSNATSTFFGPNNSSCTDADFNPPKSAQSACAVRADGGLAIESWRDSFYSVRRTSFHRKIFHSRNTLKYGRRYRIFVGVLTSDLIRTEIGVSLYHPRQKPSRTEYAVTVMPTSQNAAEFTLDVPGFEMRRSTVDVDISVGIFATPKRITRYTVDIYSAT